MIRERHYDPIVDAQRHFRLLLAAMANPGKIEQLAHPKLAVPAGWHPVTACIAFALLNADVQFWVDEREQDFIAYLSLNTGSGWSNPDAADFLFFTSPPTSDFIQKIQTGTPAYPETGATVVLQVEKIASITFQDSLQIMLQGPGVPGERPLILNASNADFFQEIQAINAEFPLGVDLFLTDAAGNLAAIPRSNQFILKA
jgi:alpha-D-ribose 1-methylphosphonate 5-triphosphate synthase subunit PhnH